MDIALHLLCRVHTIIYTPHYIRKTTSKIPCNQVALPLALVFARLYIRFAEAAYEDRPNYHHMQVVICR
eukprot:5558914-Pleurochrysis_carterae.AAC.2